MANTLVISVCGPEIAWIGGDVPVRIGSEDEHGWICSGSVMFRQIDVAREVDGDLQWRLDGRVLVDLANRHGIAVGARRINGDVAAAKADPEPVGHVEIAEAVDRDAGWRQQLGRFPAIVRISATFPCAPAA